MDDRYGPWRGHGRSRPPGRPPPDGGTGSWPPPPGPPQYPPGPSYGTPDGLPPRRRPRGGRLRLLARWGAYLLIFQLALIASLNLWRPTYSAFMLATEPDAIQEYVAIDHVSRNVLAAVMFHEDQEFPERFHAFDWNEYVARVEGYRSGADDPSGSTIHQQVAKNLFLWRKSSVPRKALETVFAVQLAPLVEDVKVLEIYVNVAEFGPDIYGICAASWYYYNRPPHDIERSQAIELAGLLPSPGHVSRVRGAPGGGVDTTVDGDPTSALTIENAKSKLPRYFDRHGLDFVRALGIEGFAEPSPDAPDSCLAMPPEVADRIAREEAE